MLDRLHAGAHIMLTYSCIASFVCARACVCVCVTPESLWESCTGQETAAKEASKSKAAAAAAATAATAATARYDRREAAKKEKAKMAAKKRPMPEEEDLEDLPTHQSKRQKKIADRATRSETGT